MKNIKNANLFAVTIASIGTAMPIIESEGQFEFVGPGYFVCLCCLFIASNAVGMLVANNKA